MRSNEVHACFFYGNGVEHGEMRKVSTFSLDQRVRKCARIQEDTLLLGKFRSGARCNLPYQLPQRLVQKDR